MSRQENPQLEDGYTRISNELLEAICRSDFNGSQMRILMLFIRTSYGYGKRQAAFPIEYIQQQTGLSERNARRAVNNLIDGNVLAVKEEATRGKARILQLNKKYSSWKAFLPDRIDRKELSAKNENGRTKMTEWADKNDRMGGHNCPNDRTELSAYKENYKENIKKDCQTRACVRGEEVIGPRPASGERVSGPCPIPTLESIIGYCQSAGLRFVDVRRFFEHYEFTGWTTADGKPVENWKGLLRKWDKQDREKAAREAAGGQPECRKVKSTGFSNFEQRDYDFDELERQLLGSQEIKQEV